MLATILVENTLLAHILFPAKRRRTGVYIYCDVSFIHLVAALPVGMIEREQPWE